MITRIEKLEAYFLGWMYSDGCVSYNIQAQSYSTKIKIQECDKDVLNFFKPLVNWTFSSEMKDGKNYPYIQTYNKEFTLNLVRKGVLPNKSYDNKYFLQLPLLKDEQYEFFIRGVFDGDGCYGLINTRLAVSLCSSSLLFIKQLQSHLESKGIISIMSIRKGDSNLYLLRIRNVKNCLAFKNYIFANNIKLSLSRKLNKILTANYSKPSSFNLKQHKHTNIVVYNDKGEKLGTYNSCKEIAELSKDENFILLKYSDKGKKNTLKATNISRACRDNTTYKGLYYNREFKPELTSLPN